MTGNFPLPTGRYTSARKTTPSSMVMGASQSICMLSRISLFAAVIRHQFQGGGFCAERRKRKSWRQRAALRPVALHRIGIGGIGAHIDAPFPFSFQRIGDFQAHLSDVLAFDLYRLAVLQRAEAFVIGAAGDEIA